MSDLTDRLRFLAAGQDDPHSVALDEAADALDAQAKEIEELRAEVDRLTGRLTYEQHRAERIGTHGSDCWKWGPAHYECAMREVEARREANLDLIAHQRDLRAEVEALRLDAERLTWLDANWETGVMQHWTQTAIGIPPRCDGYAIFNGPPMFKTLREAVDAAMAAQEKP